MLFNADSAIFFSKFLLQCPFDIWTFCLWPFSQVTENGKQERHLVATVGKFSIIWNFQQVKNSKHECYRNQEGLKTCYCYKIVLKDESIVDSRFMHEKFAVSDSPEAPLVVATPMKVSSFSISNRHWGPVMIVYSLFLSFFLCLHFTYMYMSSVNWCASWLREIGVVT